jgi:serine/threonine protein kinase
LNKFEKLQALCAMLDKAACPEDVFGNDGALAHDKYRGLSIVCHPDKWHDSHTAKAENAFKELGKWYTEAVKKITLKRYGDRAAVSEITITTKKETYTVSAKLASGDLSEVYAATAKSSGEQVALKVTRNPRNNDLVANEAARLTWLRDEAITKKLEAMCHIVVLKDAFEVQQGREKRQVNVFEHLTGYVTLAAVHAAFPTGIDIRDAAWMWNRLLGALVIPHQAGIVHGGIVPSNFMIYPEDHNGKLVGWAYSVKTGSPLKAISSPYKDFYPAEVFDKKPAAVSIDLYMAAMCLIQLIGGDVATKHVPASLPRPLAGLLHACLLSPKYRTSDVFELFTDFNTVLKSLFGPRKFRKFDMPLIKTT